MWIKYQIAVGMLSVGLMFASLLPLGLFIALRAERLSGQANGPTKGHAHGRRLVILMLGVLLPCC
jgi:hypothetical protein